MTYREKLQKEHPEKVCSTSMGGCSGCPNVYGYCDFKETICGKRGYWNSDNKKCTECWDQEIPEKKKIKRIPPDTKTDWKATDAVFKDGHREKIFYCQVNNEDFIEFATESGMYIYSGVDPDPEKLYYDNHSIGLSRRHPRFYKLDSYFDIYGRLDTQYISASDLTHIEFEEVEVDA